MRDQFDAGTSLGRTPALRRLLVALTLVSTIGMTLWGWLQQNRAFSHQIQNQEELFAINETNP